MQYHSRILGSTCFLLRRVDLFRSIYAAVLRLMYASSMVHIVPSAELPPATYVLSCINDCGTTQLVIG